MKTIEQDILTVTGGAVICHQVNCLRVMGAGLALQIKKKFPYVFTAYVEKEDWELGDCQIVKAKYFDEKRRFVANIAGQFNTGNQNMTDVDSLRRGLRVARDFADANRLQLYIPYMIGCGLAGGDWDEVSKMIGETTPNAVICKLP